MSTDHPEPIKQTVSPQEARILNHATWNPLAQLGHPGTITGPDTAIVYKEVADSGVSAGHQKARKSHYIVCELPVKVVRQKVPLDKPNVRLGVGKPLQLDTCRPGLASRDLRVCFCLAAL